MRLGSSIAKTNIGTFTIHFQMKGILIKNKTKTTLCADVRILENRVKLASIPYIGTGEGMELRLHGVLYGAMKIGHLGNSKQGLKGK